MSITNEEKLKELIGQEASKRSEIQKAKEELEKKKKEIETLEKKKTDEIAAARIEIQSKIEEMVLEEQKDYKEQEEARTKKEKAQAPLEEKLDGSSTQATSSPRGYGDAITDVMRGQPNFYSLTDYNVINRLESIAKEAANRPLTNEESTFVSVVRYEAVNMINNQDYQSRQGANYLRQELRQIDRILTLSRQRDDEMRKTDYNV